MVYKFKKEKKPESGKITNEMLKISLPQFVVGTVFLPLSITFTISRLFMKVTSEKLKHVHQNHQPVEQAGFRSGFSMIDRIRG